MKTIVVNDTEVEVTEEETQSLTTLRRGSPVKVLRHKQDYKDEVVMDGIIVGVELFENKPTIVIAAIESKYGSFEFNTVYYNKDTKNKYSVVPSTVSKYSFTKDNIIKKLNKNIEEAEVKLAEVVEQKQFILDYIST